MATRTTPAARHRAERVVKVTEAVGMRGVSGAALYEMIYKRDIGVVRLGSRLIRIPRNEIDSSSNRQLAETRESTVCCVEKGSR